MKQIPKVYRTAQMDFRPKLWNKELRFGTWNIRTLNRSGALYELTKVFVRYKIDLIALQEIRWKGEGVTQEGDYKLMFGGNKSRKHEFGTGFAVHRRLWNSLLDFEPINERMSRIKIKTRWFTTTFVNMHAPTEVSGDDTKESFFDLAENTIEMISRHNITIVLGDFNAKIGREDMYRRIVGNHSLHEHTNDNGQRLINMASAKDLIVSSTTFMRKNIYKQTWMSPDGHTCNQIDHILISRRHRSSIRNVRSYRGAEFETDHFLVLASLKIKMNKNFHDRGNRQMRYSTYKLSDSNKRLEYEKELELNLKKYKSEDSQDLNELWRSIKSSVQDSAEKVLGMQKKGRNHVWFDDTCEEAVKKKKRDRHCWLGDPTNHTLESAYRVSCKGARKIIRQSKRKYVQEQMKEMQIQYDAKNQKKFFKEVRKQKNSRVATNDIIKDKEGNLLATDTQKAERWKEYFEELLNCEEPKIKFNKTCVHTCEPDIQSPSLEEVQIIMKHLKNSKAPGPDGIASELIKNGGEELLGKIHDLINVIWEKEEIPADWKESLIIPIFKKGNKQDCSNYRGIALLPVCYKVFSNLLLKRIMPYAEDNLGDYQAGFRKNRSTIDQIFTLRQLLEKKWEYNQPVYNLFIDFQRAYDSIHRETLWNILGEFGFPVKLVNLVKICIEGSKSSILMNGVKSDSFNITTGLRQGDALSPILFNLALEKCIREVRGEDCEEALLLGFADDIDIIEEEEDQLKNTFRSLKVSAEKVGLNINQDKTKFLKISRKDTSMENFKVDDSEFKNVASFKYLGAIVSTDNNIKNEIQERILLGNRAYYGLQHLFASKLLSKKLKVELYKTIIRPCVLYGSETWSITKQQEQNLQYFENKMLRKIFGPIKDNITGEWRSRYNREIYKEFNSSLIVNEVKAARIRWLGHLERMDEQRTTKKAYMYKPEGVRPRGRPRLRWKDSVKKDLEELGMEDWEEKSLNRSEWRKLVFAAKSLDGSPC